MPLFPSLAVLMAFLVAIVPLSGVRQAAPQPLEQLPGTPAALPDIPALFPWITGLPTAPLAAALPGVPVDIPQPPSRIWWTVRLAAAPMAAPLIHGAHVFVPRLPGNVVAHDMRDGKEAWSVELAPEQPLAADGERLFVVAGEAVHALRTADGSVTWRTPVGAVTAPLLAKDGWLIATAGSRLLALRAGDGTAVWSQPSGLQRERAAISGDVLFVPLADGHVEARNLKNGLLIWRNRIGGVPGEPLVTGDDLFLGASDKSFYSLDATSGDIEWRRSVGATVRGRPSTDGIRVFFAALDNLVRAVDLRHGALKWHKGVPFRPLAEPAAAGDFLVVAGPVTDLRILRARDGEPAGTLPFPQKLAAAPAVSAQGNAIVIAAVTGGLEEAWNLSAAAWPRTAPPTAKP